MHVLHRSAPAVSPVWAGPAWRDAAVAWVDEALASRGLRRTGEAEQVRIRAWSTQLRIPTDHGTAWMKAGTPDGTDEAALYDVLVARVPDVVVAPIATDAQRRWLLLADGGPELRHVATAETVLELWAMVLRSYAALQRESCRWPAALEGRGVPRFGPGDLLAEWRRRTGVHERAAGAEAGLRQAVEVLEGGPVPLALQHDDLHSGNVFCAEGSLAAARAARVFDWGDAYVGHPFMSLLISLRDPGYHFGIELGDRVRQRLVDAYLEPWTDLAPLGELRRLVEPAVLLARVGRVLGWERALSRATPAEWEEWGDGPRHWLAEVTRLAATGEPVW